ncbi:MAG TPA: ABC transporter permease [Bryobacteraceae bacterium]
MKTAPQNLKFALRTMGRNPALTGVALASIAIGTSAAAVVFAAVKTVLLRPFPYTKPSELVQLRTDDTRSNPHADWVFWSDMRDAAERSSSIESAGLYHYAVFNLAGDSTTPLEALYGLTVSASLFPTLGVKPMLGRNILPEEDQPNHACVMILSSGLWGRRFNSDRGMIGRSVEMNGHACTVVGVMPPEFNFPMSLATTVRTPSPYIEFWAAPLIRPGEEALHRRDDFGYGAVARLRGGVAPAQASQELARISADLAREYPLSNRFRSLRSLPLVQHTLGASRAGLWLLFGASGVFMLIGCANVANLLLARGLSRQREFAIRFAVGADRAAILRQLIVESCVLAVAGGLAGFLLTAAAWRILPAIAPMSIPRLAAARADGQVFLFTVAISLVNGILFGILPAFRAAEPNRTLRDSARGGLRSLLVGAEAALAVVLVVTGSLLAVSLIRLLSIDPGFDADHVLASIIVPSSDKYPTPESRAPLWPKILDAVKEIPGVESAGTIDALPFSGENNGPLITADPGEAGRGAGRTAEADLVSADYLQTMGVKLLQGRWLREEDVTNRRPVAIIDEIAARALFPHGDAGGRRICVNCMLNEAQRWYDVVGICSSMRHASLDQNAGPAVYLTSRAFEQADFLVVRAQLPTPELARAIRRAVASADPGQPVLLSATMSTLIGDSIADRRFLYVTLSITGVLALLLAAAGVYGTVSHAASQRTREVGIRMAVGATPRDIVALIFLQGMRPVVLGSAAGILAAKAAVTLMRSSVSGLAVADSRAFALGVGLVIAAAAAACLIPACRTAKLNPNDYLFR